MRYRVIREFKDDDTHVHPVGEEWTFLGSSYVPYHSGAGFAVSFDVLREWLITFLDMPGEIKSLNVSNAAVLALYIGTSKLGLIR